MGMWSCDSEVQWLWCWVPVNSRQIVNRSAIQLVDPQMDWEELNLRISAQQQRKTKERLLVASKVGEYVNDRITDLKDPAYKPSRPVHISREPVITRSQSCKWPTIDNPAEVIDSKTGLLDRKRRYPTQYDSDSEDKIPVKRHLGIHSHRPSPLKQEELHMDTIAFVTEYFENNLNLR